MSINVCSNKQISSNLLNNCFSIELYSEILFSFFLDAIAMNAADKLTELRSMLNILIYDLGAIMMERKLDAYVIPSEDQHMSEYVPDCYQRRGWISGFTGSAGTGQDCVVALSSSCCDKE